MKGPKMNIEQLADQVQRGQISRNQIAKQHGKDVAAAVRTLLAERREASRYTGPSDDDELEAADDTIWCCDCEEIVLEEGERCESCEKAHRWLTWLESTLDAVEALAAEHEWDFSRNQYSGGFNTKSRYYELTRECDPCILGSDEECRCELLKLRISDHGSAYCSEDISLAMEASGDDHTLDILAKRLARR